MRKNWLILIVVVALTAAVAVPASAAAPCNQQILQRIDLADWARINGTCPTAKPATPAVPQPQTAAPTGAPADWDKPVPAPAPPPAATPAPAQGLTADENYVLQQVNAERAKAGLAPLRIDYRVVQTARAKAQDMIDHGYFSHQSPTLGSPFDQMKRAGISYRYAGENIAGQRSAEAAMRGWMNSPGHRANILNASFTQIGIGVIDGGPYGKMLVQQFIG